MAGREGSKGRGFEMTVAFEGGYLREERGNEVVN